MNDAKKVIIIGAGAAGLMAAARLSHFASVTVLERNEKAGKKIYITGKGRCNLTNLVPPRDFLQNVVSGDKFLMGCINRFSPEATCEYFEGLGLKLKTERGNRVFPESEKASDVTKSLVWAIEKNGGKIITNTRVQNITKRENEYKIECAADTYTADAVILATGGKSYPSTGSDGGGYSLAQNFGHTIIEPKPALVPFILKESVRELQGLTLKNIRATVFCEGGKADASDFGELLFTAEGVSGPTILTLSALTSRKTPRKLSIDLKPALETSVLDARLLREFNQNANKQLKNSLDSLLPKSLIPYIIIYAGLDGAKNVNLITREERAKLIATFKELTFSIKSTAGFGQAVVTSGGVALNEVNPKTMESRLSPALYIVGEMLDADALTGGFNLQIAWSTAMAAAQAIEDK